MVAGYWWLVVGLVVRFPFSVFRFDDLLSGLHFEAERQQQTDTG
jgi:hypothetical protein